MSYLIPKQYIILLQYQYLCLVHGMYLIARLEKNAPKRTIIDVFNAPLYNYIRSFRISTVIKQTCEHTHALIKLQIYM